MRDLQARLTVIEDNPTDVVLLRHALAQHHVSAVLDVIADGESAIRRVVEMRASDTDLFILDLNLPRRDGVEVLAALAGNGALADVPAIVMTSSDSPAEHARVSSFGAKLIRKPIDLDGFLAIGADIRNALLKRHSASSSGQ